MRKTLYEPCFHNNQLSQIQMKYTEIDLFLRQSFGGIIGFDQLDESTQALLTVLKVIKDNAMCTEVSFFDSFKGAAYVDGQREDAWVAYKQASGARFSAYQRALDSALVNAIRIPVGSSPTNRLSSSTATLLASAAAVYPDECQTACPDDISRTSARLPTACAVSQVDVVYATRFSG